MHIKKAIPYETWQFKEHAHDIASPIIKLNFHRKFIATQ